MSIVEGALNRWINRRNASSYLIRKHHVTLAPAAPGKPDDCSCSPATTILLSFVQNHRITTSIAKSTCDVSIGYAVLCVRHHASLREVLQAEHILPTFLVIVKDINYRRGWGTAAGHI